MNSQPTFSLEVVCMTTDQYNSTKSREKHWKPGYESRCTI